MPRPPSRYQRLADFLTAQPGDTVRLTFAEVEAIIGGPLPPTAHGATWWANRTKNHAHRWRAAGWRRETVSVRERWVVFERREMRP